MKNGKSSFVLHSVSSNAPATYFVEYWNLEMRNRLFISFILFCPGKVYTESNIGGKKIGGKFTKIKMRFSHPEQRNVSLFPIVLHQNIMTYRLKICSQFKRMFVEQIYQT